MKRFLFLLLILLTWYLAAMYHLDLLMVLALAELLTAAAMFLLTRYWKHRCRVVLQDQAVILRKGEEASLSCRLEQGGRLPAGPLRLRLRCSVFGRPVKRMTVSRSGPEGNALSFSVSLPCCGLWEIAPKQACVTDYLSLFRARVSSSGSWRLAVLPPERVLEIHLRKQMGETSGQEDGWPTQGGGGDEFRQLREYVSGDPYRSIHWNQTARTDLLWVKEYQPERENLVALALDLRAERPKSPEELDAFFEVLSALLAGILREGLGVEVRWCRASSLSETGLVRSTQELQALLLQLYRDPAVTMGGGIPDQENAGLCLGLDLKLSHGEEEVFRFSRQRVQQELEQTVLWL